MSEQSERGLPVQSVKSAVSGRHNMDELKTNLFGKTWTALAERFKRAHKTESL